jgi:uncharacterized protein
MRSFVPGMLLALLLPLAAQTPLLREDRLVMSDGVALSVTYYLPEAPAGARHPVLLELLPYRKDDLFLERDYSLCEYFARHGLVVARVDVRGTGSSEGRLPGREYSERELQDGVELIGQLSRMPFSNGAVGMYGISWSGFNAIQVAMRAPAALKAILAADASDDLFHDDVRYLDGILHLDEYALDIDHHNGLPRPPEYRVDARYLEDRFEAEPWLFTYLAHQRDGAFWRKNALRHHSGALKVPAFLIGGLLDGYRDSVPRMLAAATAPVKAILGPWNHAWPDDVAFGPAFEWRTEAVRWWNHWLKGEDTGLLREPRLKVFVRDPHAPSTELTELPGAWRDTDYPVPGATAKKLYPAAGHALAALPGAPAEDRLRYKPSAGAELGYWWGELTPDQRPFDRESLTYDTEPLAEPLVVLGMPRVTLDASAPVPLAHWVARLEDVHPDGAVSLVTGGAQNGAEPVRAFDLHFTTWVFQRGHRIRLAVSNGAFPMLWPTPRSMTTRLRVGVPGTELVLPLVPPASPAPGGTSPEPRRARAYARSDESRAWLPHPQAVRSSRSGRLAFKGQGEATHTFGTRSARSRETTSYSVDDADPALAEFEGTYETTLGAGDRTVTVATTMTVRSDAAAFHAKVTRTVREGQGPPRVKVWSRSIPRDGQ